MIDLNKDIKYIKGVGPNRAKILNSLDIFTLKDLITYFPREHENRNNIKKISETIDGETCLIEAVIISKMSEIKIKKNLTICKIIIRDDSMTATVTWFNQGYLKSKFILGEKYKFYGKISNKNGKVDILSPTFDAEGQNKNTGKIIPLYPLTYSLTQNTIRQIIENGLKEVNQQLEETLPEYIIKEYNLVDVNTAINNIHFPKTFEDFNIAKKRLVFEELLYMQIALLMLKNKYMQEKKGIQFKKDIQISEIINSLPFRLTKAQLKVLEEIENDMESPNSMNRLLQGDVGSRKNSNSNSSYL